jgi:uncharacterized protein
MRLNWSSFRLVVAAIALVGSSRALAQETSSPPTGITVSAEGEASVKPNKLEIEVKTSVSAELTGDAVVKYRDALKRAKDTVEKLKIDNLHVVDQGVVVTSNGVGGGNTQVAIAPGAFMAVGANGNTSVKQEVGITKSWKLTVSGIDKLSEEEVIALVAKLLDVVKDAGLATGSSNTNGENGPDGQPLASPLVMFVADDVAGAHKHATEQAFQRAKEKAQAIAELTGGQLGPAASVEESTPLSTGNEEAAAMGMLQAIYSGGSLGGHDSSVKSAMLSELPLRIALRIRFALQPNTPSNGATK